MADHTDRPDTKLAAALAYFDNVADLRAEMRFYEAWGHAATIVRAYLARPAGAPQHLVQGDRVETADGARATVTGPAPRGPLGEPAVNLDWDGEAGGPAYEHDLRRVVDARPAAGRDLTAQDVADLLHGLLGQHRSAEQLAGVLNSIARPAVARTDGKPPAVRYLSSVCDTCEHTYNAHASTGTCEMCSCQRFRDLPALNRDRAPAPPLSPEWAAAPADDTAAPDQRRKPVWQDGYTTGFADAARFDTDASNAPDLVVGKAGVPIDAYDAIQILATRPDHPSRLLAEKARAVADWWNDPPGGLWQREQLDKVAADLGELLGDLLGGGPGDVSDVRPAGQPVRDSPASTSGEEPTDA